MAIGGISAPQGSSKTIGTCPFSAFSGICASERLTYAHTHRYYGKAKNCNAIARQSVEKGLTKQFRDRRAKKRDVRTLWITQMNAGSREHGVNYSQMVFGLSEAKVEVNRKIIADIAKNEPMSFRALAEIAKVFL